MTAPHHVRTVEFIVSADTVFSLAVEAPVQEDGAVDWQEAQNRLHAQAPDIVRTFFACIADEDVQVCIGDSSEGENNHA